MKKQSIFIVFLFLIITIVFFYPTLKGYIPFPGDLLVSMTPYNTESYLGFPPGGVPNKAQGPDVMHELFPWKFFVIDSLKSGQIPFWTPYNFSGNTMMANFQSATFYPLNSIFLFLPFFDGWTIFIALAPFLAAVFMYLFLRTIKLSSFSAVFGGLVFAFTSYMVVWMEYGNITHTFLWLPLILFFTEKFIQKEKWQYVLGLTLALWFAFIAGYIQGFFYIIIITLSYFFSKIALFDKKDRTKIIIFLSTIIFAVLLSLYQLLPTLALFGMSSRKAYSWELISQLLNPWWYSITAFIPDFFGHPASRNFWFNGTYIERVSYFGVIPFLFAITSLFSQKKKEIKVFAVLFIISFLLALDLFVTRFVYLLPIPLISTTVPTRILSIFVFSGAVLSAYGVELLLQGKERKKFISIALSGVFVLVACWVAIIILPKLLQSDLMTNFATTRRNLILPTLFACTFLIVIVFRWTKIVKRYSYLLTFSFVLLFIATVGDLFYFFHKITPFSPREFVYPQTAPITYLHQRAGVDRYWGYGAAYINSNFQTYDKTYTPDGFDALQISRYTEFLSASKNGKLAESASRDNAKIAPGYGSSDLKKNDYRQKALNLIGVKYILHKHVVNGETFQPDLATFDKKNYELVWQQSPWQIYTNKQVLPRAFVAFDYLVSNDDDEIIKNLYDKNFDSRETVILEEQLPKKLQVNDNPQATVTIKKYSPNEVILQVNSTSDGLLFISDNYSSDWHATIEERPTKIYRADYTFRAIPVEKGNHTVVMWYYPYMFDIGWKISIVALICLVLGLVFLKKQKILN